MAPGIFQRDPGRLGKGAWAFAERNKIIVVSPDDRTVQSPDHFDALRRIGPVADQIPQTKRMGHALLLHIRENGLQGLEIPVNIAKDSVFHERPFREAASSSLSNFMISRSTPSGLRAGSGDGPMDRRNSRK